MYAINLSSIAKIVREHVVQVSSLCFVIFQTIYDA